MRVHNLAMDARTDQEFTALADPIRRLLLDRLREYDDQSLNIYTNALPQAISDGITNSEVALE